MPAKTPSVNLLNMEDSTHSVVGRIISFITTYGRYILITTELIVILAFVSRFSLDRQLTDLKEEISMKEDILSVNQDIENEIRKTQGQLKEVKTLLNGQTTVIDGIQMLQAILPTGVYLENLSLNGANLTTNAIALDILPFSQTLSNLSASSVFQDIRIRSVTKQPQKSTINFSLSAKIIERTK